MFGDTTIIPPVLGATDVVPAAIARTRDGGVVIAGSADHGAGFDGAVVRLDAAGRPDPAFGVGGVVVLDIGSTEDLATGIAVEPDDEILVVGETHTGTGNDHDSVIVRLTPTGQLGLTLAGTGARSSRAAGAAPRSTARPPAAAVVAWCGSRRAPTTAG